MELGVDRVHTSGSDQHVVDVGVMVTDRYGVKDTPAVLCEAFETGADSLLAFGTLAPRAFIGLDIEKACQRGSKTGLSPHGVELSIGASPQAFSRAVSGEITDWFVGDRCLRAFRFELSQPVSGRMLAAKGGNDVVVVCTVGNRELPGCERQPADRRAIRAIDIEPVVAKAFPSSHREGEGGHDGQS